MATIVKGSVNRTKAPENKAPKAPQETPVTVADDYPVVFRRLKSELFEGGAKELGDVIRAHSETLKSPVERDFDAKWAFDLKDRVARHLAVTFFWALAEVPITGKVATMRVNGQHSSWALARLLEEDALPSDLAIHLDTYSVADEAGAVMLFRQFDPRKSARSKEDISGAYQCFHPDLQDCSRSVLKVAVEGAVWYQREVQQKPVHSGDDIYKLFNEAQFHPFFQMADAFLKDGKSNELKRMAVLAAAFGTWLDDAQEAAEFWRLTALGSKRTEEDAASDLDAEIMRIRDEREKVNARDLYAKCAKAWDAFNNRIRVTNFKVNTKTKGLPVIAE